MKLPRLASVLTLVGLLGLTSLAHAQSWNSVRLTWTAPGDDGSIGTATDYDLRFSTLQITSANYSLATRWPSMPAPAAPGTSQSVTITGLAPNTTFYFALKTMDDAGNWSVMSNAVARTTTSAPDGVRPASIAISVASATDSTATVAWNAVGDDSLTGVAASYDLRFAAAPITDATWGSAAQVTGEPAPLAAGSAQSVVVRGLSRQGTYYFAIKASDESGNVSAISNAPSVTTPDTMAPATVNNLSANFLWLGWRTADAGRRGRAEGARP